MNNSNNILESKLLETGNLLTQLRYVQEEKSKKYDGLLTDQEVKLTDAIADIEELRQKQQQLHSVINQPSSAYNNDKNIKNKKLDKFLRNVKAGTAEIEVKDLRTDNNNDGGYAIQSTLANEIIQNIHCSSPLRQYANVTQTANDHLEILIELDEAEARWTTQGPAGVNTATPQLEKKRIDVHKLEALPLATLEATQDPAINLESWLIEKVADKFARAENESFVTGNTLGKPVGFLSYANVTSPGLYEYGKIEQINSGVSGGISVEGLINIQNSLKECYQNNARWFMSRQAFSELLKLKGSNEYYFLSLDRAEFASGQMSLLGKPITFLSEMPDPANDSLSIVYADMKQAYTIVDRIGMNILRDPYTSKGNVCYYTTKRVGGDVVDFQAIKVLKLS